MKSLDDIPNRLILLILTLLAIATYLFPVGAILKWSDYVFAKSDSQPYTSISRSVIQAQAPHYYFNPIIDCLIKYESSGNPEAYNRRDTDGKPKYGILQFGKDTFKEFCIDKYGLYDNIWSVSSQKTCAHRMIQDGYGGRWGTWKRCNN